jgi:hypothetical protein
MSANTNTKKNRDEEVFWIFHRDDTLVGFHWYRVYREGDLKTSHIHIRGWNTEWIRFPVSCGILRENFYTMCPLPKDDARSRMIWRTCCEAFGVPGTSVTRVEYDTITHMVRMGDLK